MCGVCGIVSYGGPPDLALLRRMMGRLGHRGPDGNGWYRDRRAALGHTRLAIIDTAGGAQPLCNEDGTVWVTFNGEIFNYVELGEELRQPRSHLPDGERHRGDRARLGGVGRGVLLPLQRPVGHRAVGPACGAAGALPRPARGTPAVLHPAAGRSAVRVRGEVHLRRPLGGARLRPRRSRPDLHLLVAGRAPHGVPRHRAARAGALRRPRPGRVPEGSLLAHHVPRAGPRARAGRPGERRGSPGADHRGDPPAVPAQRRPGRGVPVGWSRLVRHGRRHRALHGRARCTRSRCASPTASSTRGNTRSRCPRCSGPSTRTSW